MREKCHAILFDRRGRPVAQAASISYDFENGAIVPEHYHPEDQLVFASRGVMTVYTREGTWVVPPLRAVWIPARTPHHIRMSGRVSMRTLYFLPGLGRGLPEKCFVMNVSPLLRELILHACRFARLRDACPAESHILDILFDQLEAVPAVPLQLPRPWDPRARRVVKALMADPGERRTLGKLARDCGASKRTIERLFQAETGMTFGRWRQQLRLLQSLEALASGEKISTAAVECGYESTSAFIAMFRKQLGTTPGKYMGRAGV